jgi:hypothetical protein
MGQAYSMVTRPGGDPRLDMAVEPSCRESLRQILCRFTKCVKTHVGQSNSDLRPSKYLSVDPESLPLIINEWMELCHVPYLHKAICSGRPDAFTKLSLCYNSKYKSITTQVTKPPDANFPNPLGGPAGAFDTPIDHLEMSI